MPPSTYRWPSTSTDSMNTGSAIAIRTRRPDRQLGLGCRCRSSRRSRGRGRRRSSSCGIGSSPAVRVAKRSLNVRSIASPFARPVNPWQRGEGVARHLVPTGCRGSPPAATTARNRPSPARSAPPPTSIPRSSRPSRPQISSGSMPASSNARRTPISETQAPAPPPAISAIRSPSSALDRPALERREEILSVHDRSAVEPGNREQRAPRTSRKLGSTVALMSSTRSRAQPNPRRTL